MGFFDRFFGPPTEGQFAKIMVDTMRRAGDDRQSTYDKAERRLVHTKDGKQAGVTNLSNLFVEYCNAPKKDRSALLLRTCKGLVNRMDLPSDFEDVRPDLMPTVRTRSMLDVLRLDAECAGQKPIDLAWLPLSEHLVTCLVYDLPSSMRFVTQDDINTWGVTLYEALEVARQNLAERDFAVISIGDKLYMIETDDAYDATRLLLTDMIRKLDLAGQPVAMPVTRNCLLIAGSENSDGLELMLKIAETKNNDARPLCTVPVRLAGEEWEAWLPPLDHPQYEQFYELEVGYLSGGYEEQKKLLDRRDEKFGLNVFVATYTAFRKAGKLQTCSVWSKGVPTWLPRTRYVGLFDPDTKATRFVCWEQLQEVVGGMMQPLDDYPPRWLVDDFPSESQIFQMQPEDWSN